MFKSNLTRTLYRHFLSRHINPEFTPEIATTSIPSFVYVDGVQIKVMAGYFKKNFPKSETVFMDDQLDKGVEMVFFEND